MRITATVNSDSHRITFHESGVPRNFVQLGKARDAQVGTLGADEPSRFDEARFIEAVRAGRVVVSSGPFVRLEVAGRGIGEEAPAGEQEVHVTVDAPAWIDVSRIDLVVRGQTVHTWTGPFQPGVRRLDARLSVALKADDWVLAVARGERPMDFLPRPGAKPFAFTNPVWIKSL